MQAGLYKYTWFINEHNRRYAGQRTRLGDRREKQRALQRDRHTLLSLKALDPKRASKATYSTARLLPSLSLGHGDWRLGTSHGLWLNPASLREWTCSPCPSARTREGRRWGK